MISCLNSTSQMIGDVAVRQADADMECVLRMCLDLAALQRLAAADSDAAGRAGAAAPKDAGAQPASEPVEGRPGAGSEAPGPTSSAAASSAAGSANATAYMATTSAAPQIATGINDPPLPQLSCGDFELLQRHPVSVSERDAQQVEF